MRLLTTALAFATATQAHFRMIYPTWRGDSLALSKPGENNVTQWNYPCAGLDGNGSRTDFPISGGPIVWNSSHDWSLSYVNLGLGSNTQTFNVTLVPLFNETGAGVICVQPNKSALAALNLQDGQQASVQVITTSHSGAALFNCADITFRTNTSVPDVCKNSTGVSSARVGNVAAASNGSSGSSGSGSGSTGGAAQGVVPVGVMVAALAMGIAAALS